MAHRAISLSLAGLVLVVALPLAAAEDVPEGDYTDKQMRAAAGEAGETGGAGEQARQQRRDEAGETGGAGEQARQQRRDEAGQKSFGAVRKPGRGVALQSVEQALLPRECWSMIVERGLEDVQVSWGTGPRWPEVVRRMARNAGLAAAFNFNDCIVAIAKNQELAQEMAQKGGNVWRVKKGQTLREVLKRWSERVGWQLAWEPNFTYQIEYPGTIVGRYYGTDGSDGVVARLLATYNDAPRPLRPVWMTENRVIRVVERKSTRE